MKIAFLGNLFHKKTLSSEFFVSILEKCFFVDRFYGLPVNKCSEIDFKAIGKEGYDSIVIWQLMPSIEQLNQLKNNNIIFIPMYDNVVVYSDQRWNPYLGYKFFNFSSTLNEKLSYLGAETKFSQYFPDPNELKSFQQNNKNARPPSAFFWQRKNNITWSQVRTILDGNPIFRVHIHKATDPDGDYFAPTDEDRMKFHISESDWFNDSSEYLRMIADFDIYFCPRIYEGIGMSFLEAMAMGKCVIAPDRPTMNEYIKHGVNGFLYDPDHPRPIDLSRYQEIGANASQFVKDGYLGWKNNESEIIEFITRTRPKYLSKILKVFKR